LLASSNAKGVGGGDIPDPDPPLILPPLIFPTDPADGPFKILDLSGFSLPAPALPETLFGLPQDSEQTGFAESVCCGCLDVSADRYLALVIPGEHQLRY